MGRQDRDGIKDELSERLAAPGPDATFEERIAAIQAQARAWGIVPDPNWTEDNEKAFMDDLSGGL